jgi:gamma-glutamyltranspeptidase / glutathione hydrolase
MPNRLLRGLKPLRSAFPLILLAACSAQTMERAAPASASARGVVSAADPRAAEAGREILREGGSAADAAIATAIALTVVEPQSSGIGGGGFLVYHDAAARRLASYDGREEAPAAAGPGWFLDADGKVIADPMLGGKAVGVPGNFRMFELAHSRHGKLPWARLFQPAIRLARDGFAISPRMREMLLGRTSAAAMTPWARALFFLPDGQPKPVGTMLRNPELAALLDGVAAHGPDWFYTGPPARNLVRAVTAAAINPSSMTLGDLASYDAKPRDVPCGEYRGHRICGMGPPSSGASTVFAVLKQLERFDLAALGPRSPEAWHLIAESMRLAYADRAAYLGDPDYVRVPLRGLMDPAYLASRSQLIEPKRTMPTVAAGTPPDAPRVAAAISGEVPSTSHMVAVDRRGNVASLTSTIESAWGSGLTVDGYFLNNELTDFSIAPAPAAASVANRVEGGKRPLSSMSPTIVYGPDGSVRIAVGAAGGPTIIMQVAKALIGVIDWKMGAQEAIAMPGMFIRGDRIMVEQDTWLAAMIPALAALGHNVVAAPPPFKANAVEWVGGRWVGAADPRSEGVALGE